MDQKAARSCLELMAFGLRIPDFAQCIDWCDDESLDMHKVCFVVYSPANKPLSMARISLKVKVPINPMEVDHLPSALRKIASLLREEA